MTADELSDLRHRLKRALGDLHALRAFSHLESPQALLALAQTISDMEDACYVVTMHLARAKGLIPSRTVN